MDKTSKHKDLSEKNISEIKNFEEQINSLTDALNNLKRQNKRQLQQLNILHSLNSRESEKANQEINKIESLLDKTNQEVILQKEEIYLLKSRLKYFIIISKILRLIAAPFIGFLRNIKRITIYILNYIFNLLIKHEVTKRILIDQIKKGLASKFLAKLSNQSFKIIQAKYDKLIQIDDNSLKLNERLTNHYKKSYQSKEIYRNFNNYIQERNK